MDQHAVVAGELAVETHFVAEKQFGEVIIGDGAEVKCIRRVVGVAVFEEVMEVGGFGADDTF